MIVWRRLASLLRGKGLNYALLAALKESASTRRGKAEAKEPLFLFFGRGRGFSLRSVAPSSPKPSPTPLHVRGDDIALLAQSVASF